MNESNTPKPDKMEEQQMTNEQSKERVKSWPKVGDRVQHNGREGDVVEIREDGRFVVDWGLYCTPHSISELEPLTY